MKEFIKDELLEELINKAHGYGESLGVCRDIQANFEKRPVTKYLFPNVKEFEIPCTGV